MGFSNLTSRYFRKISSEDEVQNMKCIYLRPETISIESEVNVILRHTLH